MNIIVLTKQVPDTESLLDVNTEKKEINTPNAKWILNPYDEYAVEEALRIKADTGAGKVTVVSVGPNRAETALRSALAMGADEALLVSDPAADQSDPLGTARILAAAIAGMSYDLIIAGLRAVDDDYCQVPASLAELLDIPQVTCVVKREIVKDKIRCHQAVDGGVQIVESELPMLFTTQKGINEPRYASLPNVMKAKKKPLQKKSLDDIGIAPANVGASAALVSLLSISLPPERKGGIIIEGHSAEAKAIELVRLLKEEARVI